MPAMAQQFHSHPDAAGDLSQTAGIEETPKPGAAETELPDARALQDRFPEWFRTPRMLLGYTVILGALFCFFSFRPLWHTDLWGHLAYGRLIAQQRSIPQFEPFMPLAEGVPLVDTAWLSQLAAYGLYALLGVTALQFLYAATITCCLALLAWRFHERTGSLGATLAGLAAFLWIEWQALLIVRPQLAGLCCFTALLVLLTSRRMRRGDWFGVPLLIAAWANLHGSFVMGILLIVTLCVGRAVDRWRRTGRLAAAWKDTRTRRLFLLTELSLAAALLNPYGIRLYVHVFAVASSANVQDLLDWQPLTLRMRQGQAAFAVAMVIILLMRLSPRRVTAAEVLLLSGLGAAALWTSRMLVWWAPVAALSLVLHGHAVLRKWKWVRKEAPRSVRRSLWTVCSLGLAWIVFAVTPFGLRLLHGTQPELRHVVSDETPIAAADYLRKHPPRGLIFNPSEWGDYLVFAGPEKLPVFVTSHVHLVPRKVWQDYLHIDAGWADLLDRYGVNTVVINPSRQPALAERLRYSEAWTVVFQDERSMVVQRRQTRRLTPFGSDGVGNSR